MGHDKVVKSAWGEGEGAGVVGSEARGMGFAPFAHEMEHGSAAVYGIGVELRIGGDQSCKKATISVTED